MTFFGMVVNYTSTPRPSVDAVDRFRGLTVQPNQRHRCEPWNWRPNSFACPDLLRSASRSMAGRCAGWVAGIKPGSFSLSWFFAIEEPSDERIALALSAMTASYPRWPLQPSPDPPALPRSAPRHAR